MFFGDSGPKPSENIQWVLCTFMEDLCSIFLFLVVVSMENSSFGTAKPIVKYYYNLGIHFTDFTKWYIPEKHSMQKKETLFVFAGLCHQVITKCVFWAVSVATQLGCVVNVKSAVRLLLSRSLSNWPWCVIWKRNSSTEMISLLK